MPEAVTVLPPRFDGTDPATMSNPYPVYAKLRAAGPLCRFGPMQYGVTRYADVNALMRDPRLHKHLMPEAFYQLVTGRGPASEFVGQMDSVRGGPAIQQAIAHEFGPAAIRARAVRIAAVVDDLVAAMLAAGRADTVAALARPLPVAVLGELLGVPPAERSEVAARVAPLSVLGDAPTAAGRAMEAADAAVLWLRDYFRALLRDRARAPRDDLLSGIAAAADDAAARDRGADDAIRLLYAGLDTTTSLIASGCAALAAHPDQYARLRADPSLAATAVEEFLRYDAPIQTTVRMAREPVQVGGRSVRAGRVLVLMLGCANHDDRRFHRPDRLDVGRRPNPHLSFGGGPYFCVGAALARAQATAVFDRLARGCAALEPDGEPIRAPQFNFRSHQRVPVRLTPSAGGTRA
ncbi:cytochrome P450 [Micromonospora sp. CPCC 206061]|uniref:cytochrome P450 n=1 Tax=Micromonospora sp. CPCC 206061 TaxID=3122410 RepID=UPI002FEF2B88